MIDDNAELGLFEQAKADARNEYAEFSLHAMAEHMRLLQSEKEELDNQLKVVNAKLDVLRFEMIPTKMDEEGIERITFDGIGRVSLTGDMFTQVTDKQGLYAWLEEHNFGDLIQPNVNASTLKAFIKGRMKKGEELPDKCVRITPVTRASITKA